MTIRVADISIVGWVHTGLTLIALVASAFVLAARKGSPRHRKWGLVFVATLALGSALSLTIYRRGVFYFPHGFALLALVALGVGWTAARYHFPSRSWRQVHLTALLVAVWDVVGGLLNEAFVRVGWLRDAAAPEALGIAQAAAMVIFATAVASYMMRLRRPGDAIRSTAG